MKITFSSTLIGLFLLLFISCGSNSTNWDKNDIITNNQTETGTKQLSDVELNKIYSHTPSNSPSPYFDELVIASSGQEFSATQAFDLAQQYEDGNNGQTQPNLNLADHWFAYAMQNDTTSDNLYCTRIRQIMEEDRRRINGEAQLKLNQESGISGDIENLKRWYRNNINRYEKLLTENCNNSK